MIIKKITGAIFAMVLTVSLVGVVNAEPAQTCTLVDGRDGIIASIGGRRTCCIGGDDGSGTASCYACRATEGEDSTASHIDCAEIYVPRPKAKIKDAAPTIRNAD